MQPRTTNMSRGLSQALHTSSLSLSITDNLIAAKGYTYINDSIESYIKSLAVSGKSGTDITEITPTRAAFLSWIWVQLVSGVF